MNLYRFLSRSGRCLLLAVLVLILVACGKSPDTSIANGDVFSKIPADSAYLFVSTKAYPEKVTDKMLAQLSSMNVSSLYSTLLNNAPDDAKDETVQAFFAFLSKITSLYEDSETTAELAEKTGLNPFDPFAIYAVDAFPVLLRVSVADQTQAEKTIQDLMTETDQTIHTQDIDGQTVHSLSLADDVFNVYWHLNADQLTYSLLPAADNSQLLSLVFGNAKPASALTEKMFNDINSKYGFTEFGSGYFDFNAIFNSVFGDSAHTVFKGLVAELKKEDDFNTWFESEACQNETQQLIQNYLPKMYMGYTDLNEEYYTLRTSSDITPGLMGLEKLTGDAPLNLYKNAKYSMGLNLNIGEVVKFFDTMTDQAMANPFQCEAFADLNNTAKNINESVNQPFPPLIGNLQGLSLSLSELNFSANTKIPNLKGNLVIFSKSPSMLVGMGQLTLPFLAELDLEPGSAPAKLDFPMIPAEIGDVYLATSDQAIGVSVGKAAQDDLMLHLNPAKPAEKYLMTFSMDYAAYADAMDNMESMMLREDLNDEDLDEEERQRIESAKLMMESMKKMYENLGQTYGTMMIKNNQIITDQSVVLK